MAIADGNGGSYVALPATKPVRECFTREITAAAASDVHLLPCNCPTGPLEPAPRTALCEDSAFAHWEGFWCVADEGYYARCVREDGSAAWFRLADEARPVTRRGREARVLPMRRVIVTPDGRRLLASDPRRVVLLGSSRSKRTILVGTSRRRSRAKVDAGHGARR